MPQALIYRQYTPSLALAPYVACYWTITANGAASGSGRNKKALRIRVLPDCCMDAVFDLSGGLAKPGAGTAASSAFVVGPSLSPMVLRLPDSLRVVGVRFFPGGAAPFLGVPAYELAESSAPLTAFMPGFASLGVALAGEARTSAAMAAHVDRLLLELLPRVPEKDALTRQAVSALTRPGPVGRVEAAARSMGLNQKRLERAVKRHAGLTPKGLARALRFVEAVRALSFGRRPLAELALDLGFTDQAHFNREFKALAGVSPTSWLAERRSVEFLQYAPVHIG